MELTVFFSPQVIPQTKEIEIEYLLQRLDGLEEEPKAKQTNGTSTTT
jgi:hypothetical protein